MGRKRINVMVPGGNFYLHFPLNIHPDILKFINNQIKLSDTVFNILTNYLKGGNTNNILMTAEYPCKKPKIPGGDITLYIPHDIDPDVLEYINSRDRPGKFVLQVLNEFINSGPSDTGILDKKIDPVPEFKENSSKLEFDTSKKASKGMRYEDIPDCYKL